jgi:hypothetical protein
MEPPNATKVKITLTNLKIKLCGKKIQNYLSKIYSVARLAIKNFN